MKNIDRLSAAGRRLLSWLLIFIFLFTGTGPAYGEELLSSQEEQEEVPLFSDRQEELLSDGRTELIPEPEPAEVLRDSSGSETLQEDSSELETLQDSRRTEMHQEDAPEVFSGTVSGYTLDIEGGKWNYFLTADDVSNSYIRTLLQRDMGDSGDWGNYIGKEAPDSVIRLVSGLRWFESHGRTLYLNNNRTIAKKAVVWAAKQQKYYSFDADARCIDAKEKGFEGWLRRWDGWYWMQKDGSLLKEGGVKQLGGKWYFLYDYGKRAAGFTVKNGKTWYSWPGSGQLALGWFTVGRKKYYSIADPRKAAFGQVQKGWVTLGKSRYFFDSDGSMHVRWKDHNGNKYWLGEDGILKTGFVKFEDGVRFFEKTTGCLILDRKFVQNGYTYYARPKTGLLYKGWRTENGKTYYYSPGMISGRMAVVSGRTYCFQPDGSLYATRGAMKYGGKYYMVLKDSSVRGVTKAEQMAIDQMNELGWDLHKAFNWTITKIKFVNMGETPPSGEKEVDAWAIYGFQIHNGRHEGNCYVMACTFYQMAKVMGYSVRFMKGYVLTTSGRDSHGWVEICYNGRWRIVDSLSSKGWMIWYGEKGTWRYTDYHMAYEEL